MRKLLEKGEVMSSNIKYRQGVSKDQRLKKIAIQVLSTILAVLVISLVGLAVYINSLLGMIQYTPLQPNSGSTTVGGGNQKIDRENLGIGPNAPDPKKTGISNILLLGLDRTGGNLAARSDSMMIVTVDTRRGDIKGTSLMRDMYVEIPGRDNNRINTGYVFGGPALAIKTINTNFGLNIEHYAAVDFDGFTKIIDLLGGVSVEVTSGEAEIIGLPKAGTYRLDGNQALEYSRIRRIGDDFGRTDRQRTVFSALYKQGRKVGVTRIPELISTALPLVETNLTRTEIVRLGLNIFDFSNSEVQQMRLPIDGAYRNETIRNMAVLVPDMEKNRKALHEFIFGE